MVNWWLIILSIYIYIPILITTFKMGHQPLTKYLYSHYNHYNLVHNRLVQIGFIVYIYLSPYVNTMLSLSSLLSPLFPLIVYYILWFITTFT